MSEKFDMVEVKTEPNEPSKLYSVFKIRNMIAINHSRQDKITFECKNYSSFLFFLKFQINLCFFNLKLAIILITCKLTTI